MLPTANQGIEIARLVIEAVVLLIVVFKGVRTLAVLQTNVDTLMTNHIPHLFDEIQNLNRRIDELVASKGK